MGFQRRGRARPCCAAHVACGLIVLHDRLHANVTKSEEEAAGGDVLTGESKENNHLLSLLAGSRTSSGEPLQPGPDDCEELALHHPCTHECMVFSKSSPYSCWWVV